MQPADDTTGIVEKTGSVFDHAYLANKINFVNFVGGTITAVYRNCEYGCTVHVPLHPLPCRGPELTCRWVSSTNNGGNLAAFRFEHLLVPDKERFLLVEAVISDKTAEAICFRLPETCRQAAPEAATEMFNPGLTVRMFQNGVEFHGRLMQFGAGSFEIEIGFQPPQNHHWIDEAAEVYLVIAKGSQVVYSSNCRIVEDGGSGDASIFSLQSCSENARRLAPKKYRGKRVSFNPAPDAAILHPLNLRSNLWKVHDLSSSGFSILVEKDNSELFCGLIIQDIQLLSGGECLATVTAQVVHCTSSTDSRENGHVRIGFTFLDIPVADHTRLQKLLQQAEDPNAYLNHSPQQNALWEFFFETGFIYPEKYCSLKTHKDQIKEVYNNLYLRQPQFTRHFTYQKNGLILGHMAILRFYPRAWMIHHHAARKSGPDQAGLRVLEQMSRFVNESHALDSLKMDYIFFFYQPSNRFANLLFGKAVQFANDPQKCSLDQFAYGYFSAAARTAETLPTPWTLTAATGEDITLLRAFYSRTSNGLMADAFSFDQTKDQLPALIEEYAKEGFKRERRVLALKERGLLRAVFEVNLSDRGLNMSDLTNCVRLFFIGPETIPEGILASALAQQAEFFDSAEIPCLIFPAEAAAATPIAIKRNYMLWIANLHRPTDWYFAFINRIFRLSRTRPANFPPDSDR